MGLPLLALLARPAQAQVFVLTDYLCPSVPGASPTSMAGAVIKIGNQQFTSKFEGNSVQIPPGDYTVAASFPDNPNVKLGYVLQSRPGVGTGTNRINPGSDGTVRVTLKMDRENLYVRMYACPGGASPGQPVGPAPVAPPSGSTDPSVCAAYRERGQRLGSRMTDLVMSGNSPFTDLESARTKLQDANKIITKYKASSPINVAAISDWEAERASAYARIKEAKAGIDQLVGLRRDIVNLVSEAKAAGCAMEEEPGTGTPQGGANKIIDELLELDSPKVPVNFSIETMGVAKVVGTVDIQSVDGTRAPLAGGTRIELREPFTIRTGVSSSVTIQVGSVRKTIQPWSVVRIVPKSNGQLDFIEQGAATVDVRKPGANQIQTPTATVNVDGTVFTVSFDPTSRVTAVTVEEGRVAVQAKNPGAGGGIALSPGEYVEVGTNAVSAVLPAPGTTGNTLGGGASPGSNQPGRVLPNPPGNSQPLDLSGLWQDDTGGGAIYRFRQAGARLYWIVDGTSKGSFVNVAYGEISGNMINGIWVDMPGSPSLGNGTFTLRIESNNRLVKISSNPYYGAQSWTRQGPPRDK